MTLQEDNSAISLISPAARLGAAFVLGCCAAILQRPEACIAALLPGMLLVPLARPNWRRFFRRLAAVNVFVLLLWLIVPLTAGAPFYAHWGVFGISREGVRLAFLATLKANAIYCIFAALCGGFTPGALASAMRTLHFPNALTMLFLFMGRAFHILSGEWRTLEQAARLRAFRPRPNLHTWRTIGSLLALLLIRAHERAERMREAMLLRGYAGNLNFACQTSFSRRDLFFALAALASAAGLCCLEW